MSTPDEPPPVGDPQRPSLNKPASMGSDTPDAGNASQPSYGQPSYGSSEPSPYGAGTPSYGAQQPYGSDRPGFGSDQPVYGSDQPGYGSGQPGYGSGIPGYGPGQPAYGSPAAPGAYPPPRGNNGLAIASLICGIAALLSACFWGTGALFGIAAIITGVMARKRVKLGQLGQGGLAIAGIITGAIGIVVAVVFLIITLFVLSKSSDVGSCSTLPADQQQECLKSALTNN